MTMNFKYDFSVFIICYFIDDPNYAWPCFKDGLSKKEQDLAYFHEQRSHGTDGVAW